MKRDRSKFQYKSSLPSRTQQHFKDECCINNIIAKHAKTGMITHLNKSQAFYGDFSKFQDFRTNIDVVRNAMETFDSLPSQIRKRFGNDPANLISFVQDKSNYNEAVKLGLVVARENQGSKNDDKTTIKEPNTLEQPKAENAT